MKSVICLVIFCSSLPSYQLERYKNILSFTVNKFDHGAILGGGTDSDSERSSLEREEKKETIYSRVHRKPTPHKKKHRPRQGDRAVPQLPATNEHQQLIQADHLGRFTGHLKSRFQRTNVEGPIDTHCYSKYCTCDKQNSYFLFVDWSFSPSMRS